MWWMLVALACGDSAVPDPLGASLPAPWGPMALPVGDGRVEEVGAVSLHVVYKKPAEEKAAIGGLWLAHFEKIGFANTNTRSAGPLTGFDLVKGDVKLTLMVSGMRDQVDIAVDVESP